MSITNLTGNDCRFTFGLPPNAVEWDVRSIAEWGWERVAINDSNLITNQFERSIPGDLYALDPLTLEIGWHQDDANYRHQPETTFADAVRLCTLTFPTSTGSVTLSGFGFIRRWGIPVMMNNNRTISTCTIQFNGFDSLGNAGPVWTVT